MSATQEDLDQVRESIKTFQEHEVRLAKELGVPIADELIAKRKAEEENAELYNHLSPSEMLNLYQHDRDRWQAIMDANEARGLRRLFQEAP